MIAAVVSEMNDVVDDARSTGDATGYFAALYSGVTTAVERGLSEGRFTTPDRLAELTTVFARRYLEALRLHRSGDRPSESWDVAFRAIDTWRPTVLQHLLLGMNAHINLDLGVACAEVAPGAQIATLETDFREINEVLAGLVQDVQDRLNTVSPLYRFVDDICRDADRAVINFSIGRARAEAWTFATTLAALDDGARVQRIARQDAVVAGIGRRVLRPGAITSTGLLALRLTEKRNTATIIDLLSAAAHNSRP